MEIFKDIPDYEGLYQASSYGNILSLKFGKRKILKQTMNSSGYFQLFLSKNGKANNFRVHSLIAIAFLNHKLSGYNNFVVDHINNIRTDNRLENLQIITQRENISKDQSKGCVGAYYIHKRKKWLSSIYYKKRVICLGGFELEADAASAYQKALSEIKQGLDLNIIYPKKYSTNKALKMS